MGAEEFIADMNAIFSRCRFNEKYTGFVRLVRSLEAHGRTQAWTEFASYIAFHKDMPRECFLDCNVDVMAMRLGTFLRAQDAAEVKEYVDGDTEPYIPDVLIIRTR